ncbi:MAG: DMT family transporter [Planctomycetes bacterium]|nr:DMT family transporter [Planctomycetota bacterium]
MGEADDRARRQGIIALVVVQFCFGLFPLFGKWTMTAFEPAAVAAWRMMVGATILGLVAYLRHGRRFWPGRRDLLRLQLCAFLGISLNQVLYLKGLRMAPSVNAALIMCLIPVLTLLVALAFRQEHASPTRFLGTSLAFVGTAQLVLARGLDLDDGYLRGNLLMCANAASYSIYLVYVRPLTRRLPPFVVIAWVFILATWQIPLFLGSAPLLPEAPGWRALVGMAFVLFFPTTLAYFLNAYALARVSASTTAFFIFAQPLIAAVAAALVLREGVGWREAVAALAIFGGMKLALRRRAVRP